MKETVEGNAVMVVVMGSKSIVYVHSLKTCVIFFAFIGYNTQKVSELVTIKFITESQVPQS